MEDQLNVTEEMEGSQCGTFGAGTAARVADKTHPGPGGAATAVSRESSVAGAGPLVRKNRFGAKKESQARTGEVSMWDLVRYRSRPGSRQGDVYSD